MPVSCVTRGRLLADFNDWDVNRQGCINKDDLVHLLVELGMSVVDAEKVFACTDLDKNGSVNYTDFVHWFAGSPPPLPSLPPLPVSVATAQQAWRDGLFEVGGVMRDGGDASAAAVAFVDALYCFNADTAIFRPMLAGRVIAGSAAAVSGADDGAVERVVLRDAAERYFANPLLQYVADIDFENVLVVTKGGFMYAHGIVSYTLVTGHTKAVDYTFGFERGAEGSPRLFLHHSSEVPPDRQGEVATAAVEARAPAEADVTPSDAAGVAAAVDIAQRAWAAGLLEVAAAARSGQDYVKQAERFVSSLYAYDSGQVLFKTAGKAGEVRFLEAFEDAVRYFANPVLRALGDVCFENQRVVVRGPHIFTEGLYHFSCGAMVITGEYVVGYERNECGGLSIFMHNSFAPFL
eukprot:TRINITY_DN16802_c0_g1_i1.p1 TRINITY_DN16802_c0_g1~~TRINITY_DN16802_c0_g1_i1.p1  ORF type:complete len:406 (+),score=94.86 TRINITY_DN16802_c0_g1_i1:33-1250(+)